MSKALGEYFQGFMEAMERDALRYAEHFNRRFGMSMEGGTGIVANLGVMEDHKHDGSFHIHQTLCFTLRFPREE